LLIVTLCFATLRATPATKPVSPLRAPFDSPSASIGAFTAADVMLTMRPKRRAIIESIVALMSSIGIRMLASSARIHASRSKSRESPGGGPPALLTRMSGAGHALIAAARPAGVVMSQATHATRRPAMAPISSAVRRTSLSVRARVQVDVVVADRRLIEIGSLRARGSSRASAGRAVLLLLDDRLPVPGEVLAVTMVRADLAVDPARAGRPRTFMRPAFSLRQTD
jgi:hypothetical protein